MAQWLAHRSHDPKDGGSNPSGAIIFFCVGVGCGCGCGYYVGGVGALQYKIDYNFSA